jgi:hypothetical protein
LGGPEERLLTNILVIIGPGGAQQGVRRLISGVNRYCGDRFR